MAARLLAAAEAARRERARDIAARARLRRPGTGVEFLTWLAEADLPDPEAVLANPEAFVLPERGDRAYAALSSVAAAVAANPTADRWERGWRAFAPRRRAPRPTSPPPPRARSPAAAPRARRSRAEVKAFAPLLRDAGLLA